jgi:MFS family permease
VTDVRQANAQDLSPAATHASEPTGMLRSVRLYEAFRFLLIGTIATNSSFWMYQVAVGWLALEMTDSAFFVGLAGFVGGIPLLFLAIPAGMLIDRYGSRLILLIAQIGVLITASAFALTVATDVIEPWSMLLLVALNGSFMSFIFPSRTTIVPRLVERRDLTNAIALSAAAMNSTRVIGPSLAGTLIAVAGSAGAFTVAAALQVIAFSTTFRLPKPSRGEGGGRTKMTWSAVTVGFRVVARSPLLTRLVLLALVPTVLVIPYINLMPVFARDVMELSATGLGLLMATIGLGAVGGSLWVARFEKVQTMQSAQSWIAVAFATLVMVFALTHTLIPAIVLLFGAGWMSAAYLALNQTALQLNVDDEVRGRVQAIYMLTWGMLPLGQLAVGSLADLVGTPTAVAVACAIGLVAIGLISRRPHASPAPG